MIQQIEGVYDTNESELNDLTQRQKQFNTECDTAIASLKDKIGELDYKSVLFYIDLRKMPSLN